MDDTHRDAIDGALARAVVYRTLSLALQPPNDERLRQMGTSDGFRDAIAALRWLDERADETLLDQRAGETLECVAKSPVVSAFRRTCRPAEAGHYQLSNAESFSRLFGHTARGAICACETEYGPDNGFHQPQQLADIAGYYLAFGLQPVAGCDARVDHIACECEFMDFLNRKEAVLLAGDAGSDDVRETLEVTRQARRAFLRDHLARFGAALATRLTNEDPDGFYGVVGQMLLAVLTADCARLGVRVGPNSLLVRPEMVDDTPMACGTPDQLIQIERRAT